MTYMQTNQNVFINCWNKRYT